MMSNTHLSQWFGTQNWKKKFLEHAAELWVMWAGQPSFLTGAGAWEALPSSRASRNSWEFLFSISKDILLTSMSVLTYSSPFGYSSEQNSGISIALCAMGLLPVWSLPHPDHLWNPLCHCLQGGCVEPLTERPPMMCLHQGNSSLVWCNAFSRSYKLLEWCTELGQRQNLHLDLFSLCITSHVR